MPVGAPAKINLFLHVGDKRADGFHALESLVVFTRAGDVLNVAGAEELSLTIAGPFAQGLSDEGDNLVLRAARKLADKAGFVPKAHIELVKNLPVASGIGGGSADAAAALRALNALWHLNFSARALRELAADLGSDVPVCVDSVPAWMEGRGERVTPLQRFPELPVVLVNPGVSVPTGSVFAALQARSGTAGLRPDHELSNRSAVLRFLAHTANDLEAPAIQNAPVIADVLGCLRKQADVQFARMSGSGATCFALFPDGKSAETAAQSIGAANSAWWVKATAIAGTA